MSAIRFVNRFEELASLNRGLDASSAALIRVYGRRRLGKTELLTRLVKERGGLYLLVDDAERPRILDSLSGQVARQDATIKPPLRDWDDLWAMVRDLDGRLVVIDEFQRLFDRSPEAVTRLQDWWDRELKSGPTKLVICGSSVGMMQRITKGRSGPLFGRLTQDLRLRAFSYGAVRLLYPNLPERDRLTRYAIFGGTPHYHQFSVGQDLDQALRSAFLESTAPLQEEPANFLQHELRESRRYNSILFELGSGTHEFAQIASKTESRPTSLGPYLQYLMKEFDLVRLDDPLLGKKRRGRYQLTDPFFSFYYRFIYPNLPRLELGRVNQVLGDIRRELDLHVSRVFEDVARQALTALNGASVGGVQVEFDEIGHWWNREGEELDIVAASRTALYCGEVKWTNQAPSRELVKDLERKSLLIEGRGKRKIVPIVVSREPLPTTLREALRERGGFGLDLSSMSQAFDAGYAAP